MTKERLNNAGKHMNYTFNEQLKIDGLIKQKIRDLHEQINNLHLSERQKEQARLELKQYQELQYKNRMIRQIGVLT